VSGDPAPAKPGPWARRILRAVLPTGVVLLVVWFAYVGVVLVVGAELSGLSIVQAVFGLLTSLILIVTGYQYRKHLGEG
jgi:hypothetical protein